MDIFSSTYLYFWLVPIVWVLASLIHTAVAKRPLHKGQVLEIWLMHLLFWGVGVGCIMWFIWNMVTPLGKGIAQDLGWPTGTPLQTSYAFWVLGLGVVGLLTPIFRAGFWICIVFQALIIGITEMIMMMINGSPSTGSWWLVLFYDGVGSVLLFGLLIAYRMRAGSERFWHSSCCCCRKK